jgi:AcrR family transcriptional regulator
MSVSSGLSKSKRRVPQRDRGERRVAEVLDAASEVIAEVGYDAATMTEIAERAGASIGALYQYFPNKEAIALALRQQYGDEMEARWLPLKGLGARLSINDLVDRILDVIIEFIHSRPAYMPLQGLHGNFRRTAAKRNRLRELFAVLFREKRPELSHKAALHIANVTIQVIKGMSSLYADAEAAEREEIVREFKLLLSSYLRARLRG